MTSEFMLYLRLGFEHISDLNGYDHILFVIALAVSWSMLARADRHFALVASNFPVGPGRSEGFRA